MKNKKIKKGKVIVYRNKVEVRLEKETVWLTLNQISYLFKRDKSVISRHLRNIFKEKELTKKSTVAKFATVQKEGERQIVRDIEHYNLDMIISVGYRVNSKRGTQFRIWATNVLRKHLVNGYTLNQQCLVKDATKYKELQKAIELISNVESLSDLSPDAKGIIRVISDYRRALDILDDFDHQNLSTPKGTKKTKYKLTYKKARKIIDTLRKKFKDSDLVGQEKDQSFKSSIGAIYQTFGKKELYPTLEEKAAYLLYFVVKNHSFVDGNKRIAAALFICFLDENGFLYKKDGTRTIDENALVGLTLMIASSNPKEKDKMIRVTLNLLHNK
ncbi:MAG: virulence RhuM family protein [Candidatus Omnitrophica bacterium]|nr:virulence RhuM family protein [Candidatus Omnitrophota bacterium]MCF7909800.1 virulence RhuM family protein [Candidatus Omnitrophota bacterium]